MATTLPSLRPDVRTRVRASRGWLAAASLLALAPAADAVDQPFACLGGSNFQPTTNVLIDTDTGGRLVMAGANVLDEDTGDPEGQVEYRVFDFSNVTIDPGITITAIGSHPLIWCATDDVVIAGTVDVSGVDGAAGDEGGVLLPPDPMDPSVFVRQGGGGGGGGGAGGAFAAFGDTVTVASTGQILARGGEGGLTGLVPECAPSCCAIFPCGLGYAGEGGPPGAGGSYGGDGGASIAGGAGGTGGQSKKKGGGGGGGGGGFNGTLGPGGQSGGNGNEGDDGGQGNSGTCPANAGGGGGGAGGANNGANGGAGGISGSSGQAGLGGGPRGGGGGGGGGSSGIPGGHGGRGGNGGKKAGGGGGGGGGCNAAAGNSGNGGGGGSGGGQGGTGGGTGVAIASSGGPAGGGVALLSGLTSVTVNGLVDARGGVDVTGGTLAGGTWSPFRTRNKRIRATHGAKSRCVATEHVHEPHQGEGLHLPLYLT